MAKPSKQAQSIIELAVFGAVLFFLIAGIASVYLNGSFQQNAMLQSMRRALYKSYTTSQRGEASRNSATYIMYEDRLGMDVSKFGAVDRQPLMMSGGGSMTKNMLMPVDYNETRNVPVVDVKINGQEFNFTTSAFVNYKFLFDGTDVKMYMGASAACPGGELQALNGDENKDMLERLAREWKELPEGGFPPFYTSIVRNNGAWADNDRAFDYNRNGDFADDFPPGHRKNYATWQWQWKGLGGVAGEINAEEGAYPSYDINGDLQEETIYGLKSYAKGAPEACGAEAAYAVAALTPAAGEWNMEKQKEHYADPNNAQGFRPDMRIYTQMQCDAGKDPECVEGQNITYLDIKEGKRYSLDGTPVNVSVVRKAQYDVIERILQLNQQMVSPEQFTSRNPDVEVVCGGSGGPGGYGTGGRRYVGAGAGCCASGTNILKTCFDRDSKALYIRSRINDKRGRKWITSTDQDFTQTIGVNP